MKTAGRLISLVPQFFPPPELTPLQLVPANVVIVIIAIVVTAISVKSQCVSSIGPQWLKHWTGVTEVWVRFLPGTLIPSAVFTRCQAKYHLRFRSQ